jgi:hypothetical protein
MSRSEFRDRPRLPLIFRDRESQREIVNSHIELLRSDSQHFGLFEIVGIGGAGKTSLLNELRRTTWEVGFGNGLIVWVSLEAEAAATEISPLRAIRGQLRFRCVLFDAALALYANATGQPVNLGTGKGAQGLGSAVDAGLSLAGFGLPLGYAVEAVWKAGGRVLGERRYAKHEFEHLDSLRNDANALRRRLPHYLGLDIDRNLLGRDPLIVFYDAYDRQSRTTIEDRAPWLREFIGTIDRGLHLVSSREGLRWPADEWEDVTHTIVVDQLPEEEARELIRASLGVLDATVEDRLIAASQRLPLFLAAGVEALRLRILDGFQPSATELPTTPEGTIGALLDHLDPASRDAAIALASVQFFDVDLYLYLVAELRIPLTQLQLDSIPNSFFVLADGPHGLLKIHDALASVVRSAERFQPSRQRALEAATRYLAATNHHGDLGRPELISGMLRAILEGWHSIGEIPTDSIELLIDVGYSLLDAGYWNEILGIALAAPLDQRNMGPAVLAFLQAIGSRRAAGVARALGRLEDIEADAPRFGKHFRSFELEVAYLSEIGGNYVRAREEFNALNAKAFPFDPHDRWHLRSRSCHADMLIMDGRFVDGSRLLLEAYELLADPTQLQWVELVRLRGHAHRFSFVGPVALRLYQDALRAAAHAPAVTGRLYTNLAETLCWEDSDAALDAARISLEINSQVGNLIEIAKCESAIAIASARAGKIDVARAAAQRASKLADDCGYPAGGAFAAQASAVVEGLAGDRLAARAARRVLLNRVDALGTYHHLIFAPTLLDDAEHELEVPLESVEWIDPQSIRGRLAALIR